MFRKVVQKVFGSRNDRLLRKFTPVVREINQLEPSYREIPKQQFSQKTQELRNRITQKKESLDNLIPEAFALVREASRRALNMRHFDVQLIGGLVLHSGKIAEMRTGEGKTLVATLSAYLNALQGQGVHVVTVNDYLARRDAEWMGKIYNYLGMEAGVVHSGISQQERINAYKADITYGTNNEFGFDYLRDNMVFRPEFRVQRDLSYAIVDEIDSVLIDEARTPLIISGSSEESVTLYQTINKVIPQLKKQNSEDDADGDFSLDEKNRQTHLTERGQEKIEKLLKNAGVLSKEKSLFSVENLHLLYYINACLRAHACFNKDVDYIVKQGEIVIIDEFTGRAMPGRRWSDGLHQAIEAKENLSVHQESQTLATITLQNYFRLYHKISGMTGTADTEAYEFQQIYNLEVVVIPTNRQMIRKDMSDIIFLKKSDKYAQIVKDVQDCRTKEQPVLVGTTSIETSEHLSMLLKKEQIPHQVLNAKLHEKEAEIIAQAGQPGHVTIATNMAGRGTDIILGGNYDIELDKLNSVHEDTIANVKAEWEKRHQKVINSGGLHIIGSSRHDSRRIDNQLRGRAGRQGDPGSSRFYLSLEDDLMRIFASAKVANIMQRLGMKEGEMIESGIVTRAIENAQRKVESHNFEVRKQLLEFDDVMNEQRKVFYKHRTEIMLREGIEEYISDMIHDAVEYTTEDYLASENITDMKKISMLESILDQDFSLKLPIKSWLEQEPNLDVETLQGRICKEATALLESKLMAIKPQWRNMLTGRVILEAMDAHWKDHLLALNHLRQGVFLRGYANKNPKQEYKKESFALFVSMLEQIKLDAVRFLSKMSISDNPVSAPPEKESVNLEYTHENIEQMNLASAQTESKETDATQKPTTFVRSEKKVGRNNPCPCGSGKKYKHCHGKI